jgi:apolipoprotein N-acyltransferase
VIDVRWIGFGFGWGGGVAGLVWVENSVRGTMVCY